MLCPNCETENRDDARFCDECGFPLSGSISRPAGAASPSRASDARKSSAADTGSAGRADRRRGQGTQEKPSERLSRNAEADAPRARDVSAQDLEPEVDFDDIFEDEPAAASSRPHDFADDDPDEDFDFEQAFAPGLDEPDDFDDFFSDDDYDEPYREPAESGDTLDFGDDFWRADSTDQMPRISADLPKNRSAYRASNTVERADKGRIAIIAAGALVAVIAIVAVVGFLMGLWGGKAIPNVIGMTEVDARSVLEDEGFSVRTTQVKSDETEGLVLIMDPGAGSHAPEGSEVIIHIATARFVPDIQGKKSEEARAMLEEAGYDNVKYEVEYTDSEEGIVMSVSPDAGTRAKSSMEIIVKVSENYKVPSIEGQDLDTAKRTIENAGLSAEVEYIDSDQYPDGTIMGTTPDTGTKVSKGDAVTITVTRTRGIELTALTEELLSEGSVITIDGVDWQVESVISLSYQGNDTVAYTATGKPVVSVRGQTLVGSSETIDGTVVWSSDNEVVSIG